MGPIRDLRVATRQGRREREAAESLGQACPLKGLGEPSLEFRGEWGQRPRSRRRKGAHVYVLLAGRDPTLELLANAVGQVHVVGVEADQGLRPRSDPDPRDPIVQRLQLAARLRPHVETPQGVPPLQVLKGYGLLDQALKAFPPGPLLRLTPQALQSVVGVEPLPILKQTHTGQKARVVGHALTLQPQHTKLQVWPSRARSDSLETMRDVAKTPRRGA